MIQLPPVGDVAISVIPNRKINKVKIHLTVRAAIAAVTVQSFTDWREHDDIERVPEAQIYTVVDNEWHLLYDVPTNTPTNELPWKVK
jgi:hypothetical protein